MSDLNCDSRCNFDKYKNDTNYDILSFSSKFDYLKTFNFILENLLKIISGKCGPKEISFQ